MTAADYVGIATLITATAAAIVSIIVALRQVNITTRVNETHDAVQLSNGHTIGEVIEANDLTGVTETPPPPKP